MIKKNGTPTLAKARKMSAQGLSKRTNIVINSCINTINSRINCAADNGEYSTTVWFSNNSGVLTPMAIEKITTHFSKLGYYVDGTELEKRDEYAMEEYCIRVSWEEATC